MKTKASKPKIPPLETEIRLNDEGLDEVCCWGHVHLEKLSETHWCLLIDTADGKNLHIPIFAKNLRSRVDAFAEVFGKSDLWRKAKMPSKLRVIT